MVWRPIYTGLLKGEHEMRLCEVETTVEFYDWVDDQIEIPFLDGVQAQGDVLVVPSKASIGGGAVPVER